MDKSKRILRDKIYHAVVHRLTAGTQITNVVGFGDNIAKRVIESIYPKIKSLQFRLTAKDAEIKRLEEANSDVRARINKAESIIKKFCDNVAIGEPSWGKVILPEIEEYQGIYFSGNEITIKVDAAIKEA